MDRDLRRLILAGAAALVLLFTGRALISALWDVREAERQIPVLHSRLRSGGEADSRPSRAALTAAADLRDELQQRLDAVVPALAAELPPEFSVGPGESPDLRYIEVVRREQEELVKGAAYVGRSVPPNLGLPDLNPTGLEDVLRTLRSLHVVSLVTRAALDAGVEAVEEIRMPPPVRRGRSESGFLRLARVDFVLRGTPAAVRDALAAIAGGQPYLALDELRLEALDEHGERVRAQFGASAISLDLDQPLAGAGN